MCAARGMVRQLLSVQELGLLDLSLLDLSLLDLPLPWCLWLEEHFSSYLLELFLLEPDFSGVVDSFFLVHWLWRGLAYELPWELWGGGCKSDGRSFDLFFFFF